MDNSKENELTKLRRAIEDQRMKVELSGKGSHHHRAGSDGYSVMMSPNHLQRHNGKVSNSQTELDNVYPVFVHPDQENWSRSASASQTNGSASNSCGSTMMRNNGDNTSTDSINKRVSSGSLSSVSSHVSGSSSSTSSGSTGSGPEIEYAMKQGKKKRWQFPLKSTFSKGVGSKSQSSSQPDLLDSEDSGCPVSPTLNRRNIRISGSTDSNTETETVQELMQVVQEKEKKLTEIRLEALTSQHQIIQLKERISQMQNEMVLLKLENERLQGIVESGNQRNEVTDQERPYSPASKSLSRICSSSFMTSTIKGATFRDKERASSFDEGAMSSSAYSSQNTPPCAFQSNFSAIDCQSLLDRLSPDHESEGFQVRFIVTSSSTMLLGKRSIVIGSVPVPRRATWEELDHTTETILSEYCRVIDGNNRLGLSAASVEYYTVGDLRREKGGKTPDLLPCAYIVGDVDAVEIKLRDASNGHTDQMAFDMLISRDTLDCYVSMLLQQGRIILEGPAGTGKNKFAMSLAEYLVSRLRSEGGNTMVTVIDSLEDGGEKLSKYLSDLSSRPQSAECQPLPAVFVLENIHSLPSISTLDQLLTMSDKDGRSPYIIITTQPIEQYTQEIHLNFKVISCACDSPHVQPYLTRALRRSLVEHILTSQHAKASKTGQLSSIILWIPLCWQHVNRFLDKQNLLKAGFGPKVFLDAPINVNASCKWFVNLWNKIIVPQITSAMAEVKSNNGSWEDPTKWVINSFPWDCRETGVIPARHLSRLESQEVLQLPSYPSAAATPDEIDYMDLPLPPPPLPVLSPMTGIWHTNGASRSSGDLSKSRNGSASANSSVTTSHGYWNRTGSSTLKRTPERTSTPTRYFNTVGDKPQKYRGNGVTNVDDDPLKSMLAQLKQAALSDNNFPDCRN